METTTLPQRGRPGGRVLPESHEHVEKAAAELPDPRRWLVLAVICSASFLGVLDFFIVNVAIPSIQINLDASLADVQLVVAGYALTYAVLLITGGRLGDLYGRKRLFLLGMTGFTLASALCGLALSPQMLIGSRVLQGAAGAVMFPQVMSIIQVNFHHAERVRAFSILGAVVGAASFSGNVLGGVLIEQNLFGLGWRPIFLVNLPIGLAAVLAAIPLLHESHARKAARPDLVGVVIATVGLLLLVYPLVRGQEQGWPWWAFAALAVVPLIVPVFIWYERWLTARGGTPLVELGLFRDRTFVLGLLTILPFFAGLSAFFITFTLFLQKGLGLGPGDAGLTFAPFAIGYFTASTLAVRLATRLGRRSIQLGAGMMAASVAIVVGLVHWQGTAVSALVLTPLLLVYGTGQGLVIPTMLAIVLSDVPPHAAGSASGLVSTTQNVALSLGVVVIGSIFNSALSGGFGHAIGTSLLGNIILLAVTFLLVYLLPAHTSRSQPAAPVEM